jgi:hypothetical protein
LNRILYTGSFCLVVGSLAIGGPSPLTQQEVIRIADSFAIKEGVCLSCYKRPVIEFHKAKAGNYWSAFYAPVPSQSGLIPPSSDISIRVDEASRTASEVRLQ